MNGIDKTRKLTLQREEFLRLLFSPEIMFNASEAYRIAYPKAKGGHNRLAGQLMANNDIKQAIAKKRAEISKETGMTIEKVQQMYQEDRVFAKTVNQAGACVSATTGIARLYGYDKDNNLKESTIIVINPPRMSKVVDNQEL